MTEWWRGAVIYQIYPRSFQDDNGDGIGDLVGITRRLDHVASLGVDAIWLSPIFTSPMADMGYDVSDYRDIDPGFGTLADFDRLIAKAHDLGLKVIVDQVLSHSSDQHEWFQQSRMDRKNDKADWYVWVDPEPDGSPPNNWLSVFGGSAWAWESRRRQYYLHNFMAEQPDLNFHNTEVQDALLDVMRFWLERGVDGFRLDTVNYYFHDPKLRSNGALHYEGELPPANPYGMQDHIFAKTRPENIAFLERMRALTDEYDDRAMVGEIGEAGEKAVKIMADYTRGNGRLHMAYSFDMLGPDFSASFFREKIDGFYKGAPDGWPCWSFSNHDVMRHPSRWEKHGTDTDAVSKQAIALLASFEGSIGIYQGEELGQTDTELVYEELTDVVGLRFWPDDKGRDGCRTPMVWEAGEPNAGFSKVKPWLPVKEPQSARAVDGQEARNASVLHHYREVLAFRKASPELLAGKTVFLDLPEPILGFRRVGDETVTCYFNLSPKPAAVPLDHEAVLMGPCVDATINGRSLELGPNGFAWLGTS